MPRGPALRQVLLADALERLRADLLHALEVIGFLVLSFRSIEYFTVAPEIAEVRMSVLGCALFVALGGHTHGP